MFTPYIEGEPKRGQPRSQDVFFWEGWAPPGNEFEEEFNLNIVRGREISWTVLYSN